MKLVGTKAEGTYWACLAYCGFETEGEDTDIDLRSWVQQMTNVGGTDRGLAGGV
jgi:hypothetical protein